MLFLTRFFFFFYQGLINIIQLNLFLAQSKPIFGLSIIWKSNLYFVWILRVDELVFFIERGEVFNQSVIITYLSFISNDFTQSESYNTVINSLFSHQNWAEFKKNLFEPSVSLVEFLCRNYLLCKKNISIVLTKHCLRAIQYYINSIYSTQ